MHPVSRCILASAFVLIPTLPALGAAPAVAPPAEAAAPAAETTTLDAPEEELSVEELQRAIEDLRKEIARLKEGSGDDARVAELERRIDLLAQEIEALRTGGAVDETPLEGEKGLGPAASTVYRKDRGVAIGGYGEMLYTNYSASRQDGTPSDATDELDYLRQILYFGYKFSESILFNSEIEFEHGSTEEGGSVSVEFAYLEFQARPEIGLRAGMLLVPVGFVNELHEPPIFYGARRPEVERAIIPTTWRENGAGLFGAAGPFQYRGYVVAGLDSAGFSAGGIRGGRQNGSESRAENFAATGRLDFVGIPGLLLGASFYSGGSGQGAVVDDRPVGGSVTLFDVHGQFEHRGLHARGLWSRSTIADVALINEQNGLEGDQSVGERQGGWYVEAAFDLFSLAPRGRGGLSPYLRYEELDTQKEVPAGWERQPATDRRLFTAGLEIKPIPQVVFKLDYQNVDNEAGTGIDRFNFAMGYLF